MTYISYLVSMTFMCILRIDAVYERDLDGKIIFFSGNKYWIYDGNSFLGTRPLTDFGVGDNITSLDAAFVWGKNKKTYLFSGDQYWR